MRQTIQQMLNLLRAHDPRVLGSLGALLVVVALLGWWWFVAHRPTAFELERRRREALARGGRITDGVILDARTLDNEDDISATPQVLVYSYQLAGLTYNCAQDVSSLPEKVLGYRIDQSVQVRYDPRNPGNSILVSESWSGLWMRTGENTNGLLRGIAGGSSSAASAESAKDGPTPRPS